MLKRNLFLNSLIALLVIGGVSTCFYLILKKDDNHQVIKFNGDETKEVYNVSLDSIYPGNSFDYKISIQSKLDDAKSISLNFKEEEESSLKNYLDLTIYQDDKEIKSSLFSSYFETNLSLVSNKKETNLVFKYLMPKETTNEAKNATANFSLEVVVSHL